MNPIAATGLISLGKTLLENTLLKPSGPLAPPDGDAFLQMLDKAGSSKTQGIAAVLTQYGVHSLDDLRQLHSDLRRQLLDDPALATARTNDPQATLHLSRGADGTFQVNLSNGRTIDLVPGSQTAQTAEALHHLSTFLGEDVSTARPGEILLAS